MQRNVQLKPRLSPAVASGITFLLLSAPPIGARPQDVHEQPPPPPGVQTAPPQNAAQNSITLAELERLAMAHNPTLAEAAAGVQASEGREAQSHLYPNPTVGYEGREITPGPIYRGGEQGFFVEQPLITAGKLGLSRQVAVADTERTRIDASAQRERVLNDVRRAYYRALGAQEMLALKSELANRAQEAATTSSQLQNIGQADEPDVLESQVEAGRADLELTTAKFERELAWQQLAVTVGVPSLDEATLAGRLDDPLPAIDRERTLQALIDASPAIQQAKAAVTRAEAAVKRARAGRVPDVDVRAGADYNRELLETMNRPVGWEGEAAVGVTIPIFDRKQGDIAAAAAELARSRQEVERVRLDLRMAFSAAYRDYDYAQTTARTYHDALLPSADRAYGIYLDRYRAMAASYPQVLMAQRTLFELREEYTRALVQAWVSAVTLQGNLLEGGLEAPGMARER